MRQPVTIAAFLLVIFGLLTRAAAADPIDDARRFVNGSWVLEFREDGQGGAGPQTILLTVTWNYDGTMRMTRDQLVEGKDPVRQSDTTLSYRIDDAAGASFKITSWRAGGNAVTGVYTRTGPDTLTPEGSDVPYTRVPGSGVGLLGALPPQPAAPGAGPAGAPPGPTPGPAAVPAAGAADPQRQLDRTARAYIVGRWASRVKQDGLTYETIADYEESGLIKGTQTISDGNGRKQELKLFGAYAISAQNDRNFTLYFFFSGLEAQMQTFEIVDANTVRHTAEGWSANRQ